MGRPGGRKGKGEVMWFRFNLCVFRLKTCINELIFATVNFKVRAFLLYQLIILFTFSEQHNPVTSFESDELPNNMKTVDSIPKIKVLKGK